MNKRGRAHVPKWVVTPPVYALVEKLPNTLEQGSRNIVVTGSLPVMTFTLIPPSNSALASLETERQSRQYGKIIGGILTLYSLNHSFVNRNHGG